MGPVQVEAFRYNRWANLYLLGVCAKLTPKQLELTSPGTYGTIAATWQHLVGAERRLLWRLGGDVGRFSAHRKFPGIATLRKEAEVSGDQLIETAKHAKSDVSVVTRWPEGAMRINVAVLLIQALHHGNDHRTHLCTILGHHGIPYDEMDVWAYGASIGAAVQLPKS